MAGFVVIVENQIACRLRHLMVRSEYRVSIRSELLLNLLRLPGQTNFRVSGPSVYP